MRGSPQSSSFSSLVVKAIGRTNRDRLRLGSFYA
jgi:hypothetical protein